MLRAGKKLLVEIEPEGRRAVAELRGGAEPGGGGGGGPLAGLQTYAAAAGEPQDSQALPSSLLRSGECFYPFCLPLCHSGGAFWRAQG